MSNNDSGVQVYAEFATSLSDLVRTKEELEVIKGNPDLGEETEQLEQSLVEQEKKVRELADELRDRYDIDF